MNMQCSCPYQRNSTVRRDNPCFLEGDFCEQPYGFRNVIPLVDDINLFERTLKDQTFSRSLDRPEGGLDALMQATVCRVSNFTYLLIGSLYAKLT
ncbi:integrin beta-6-like isoform X2 [Antedon mediterranea]|uniref:integrin beta-6-like isoform X2 n=1 Tax=Antedon mediterranea TaxID=105859 RepID=UPI003AF6405A